AGGGDGAANPPAGGGDGAANPPAGGGDGAANPPAGGNGAAANPPAAAARPATVAATARPGSSGLAHTGTAAGVIAVVALILIGAGVFAVRRRRAS
ncbi:LPXTG cell wall anchor domain-containing protein, partial [uncultured Actinomyces sp.]|uniref:LPXTG cell wall anchor domain-containing protein n=1 Tax=uncultured Actinomyces sp. TaxID=249061 RepID=UPI00288AC574